MESIKDNIKLIIIVLIIVFGPVILYLIFFNKNSNNEYFEDDDIILKDYAINEVIPVYVTDEELAKKYLSEYVDLLFYNREEAYKLLDTDIMVSKFKDYNAFSEYIDTLMTDNFIRASVKSYRYGITNGVKTMNVVDAENNLFVFKEKSLMNYTVEL